MLKPYITQKRDKYFLCYQITKAELPSLIRVLYSRKSGNKKCVPIISDVEPGVMVKRDISLDDFISFAKNNNILVKQKLK